MESLGRRAKAGRTTARKQTGRSEPAALPHIAQREQSGVYWIGDSTALLKSSHFRGLQGRINLILTSPPFPLNSKKSYGNLDGERYLRWFSSLAPIFNDLLAPSGSLVIEMGNSWEPGRPVQSMLHLQALMGLAEHKKANLRLIQQFVCYNPSRLPSPAQWVTVKRIRAVDSFTHVWWFAKSDLPKADNRRVLRPYSKAMRALLERKSYNSGRRPSEHVLSKRSFLKRHRGAIAHNFFEAEALDDGRPVRLPNAFAFSNTRSNDYFSRACKAKKITPHPARMPEGLAAFFIKFLTKVDDVVLDPFAGSNTSGYVAARLGRSWIAIDRQQKYVRQSKIRFKDPLLSDLRAWQRTRKARGRV
jgi:hypothetical protein